MQYGIEVNTYKRVSPKNIKNKTRSNVYLTQEFIYCLFGMLLSRVAIPLTENVFFAPFGLVFYWALISVRSEKKNLYAFISIMVGYISIISQDKSILIYILCLIGLFAFNALKFKINTAIQISTLTIFTFIMYFVSIFIFFEFAFSETVFYSAIKSVGIVPIYLIFRYFFTGVEAFRYNKSLNVEELISSTLLLSLVVMGVRNFSVFNMNLQNVLSLVLIIVVSYILGAGSGAAMGVCLGFITGITTGVDMMFYISLYSLCGLVIGVFKDSGKLFATLSFILSFLILTIYSDTISINRIIEMILAVFIFVVIPNNLLTKVSKEFERDNLIESAHEIHLNGMKREFEKRISSLKSVLSTMALSITSLSENDKLLLKSKESALVESLADRVCVGCSKKNKCWQGELHQTYSLFTDTISNFELGREVIPRELDKKCKNKYRLIRDVKDVLAIQQAKEVAKNRLTEGRILVANHINSMSLKLGEMIREFEVNVDDCLNIDKILRKRAKKKAIRFESLYSYLDGNGRLRINITLKEGDDEYYCLENILPMINNLVRVPLSISTKESCIDDKLGLWVGVIEETPKFMVKSFSSSEIKQSEEYSGDNFYYGNDDSGKYITIVSDGMGSGAGAGVESKICIDLIKKYLQSGYSIDTAMDVVNSIMSMKFNEDEKFATIDFNNIDLYSGEATFIKFGGVVSFIKRKEFVEVIKSESLPIGILDNLEVNKIKTTLNDGDIIITITDGVIDVDKQNQGGYLWLKEYLESYEDSAEKLSDGIIEMARSISGDNIYDDMTVIVSKVYSVF